MIGVRGYRSGCILALVVARMSDLLVATSGTAVPACRFAHAGYLLALAAWIVFNSDADRSGKEFAATIDSLLHQAADRITDWPDGDLYRKFTL